MDCKTARTVWNHPEGFIAGVREHLPGVVERLEAQIESYIAGKTNPYDQAVKQQAGDGRYYNEHADTEDDVVAIRIHDVVGDVVGKMKLEEYFTSKFSQPIFLGNMCCGNCITHDGALTPAHLARIQVAAVNIEPDGSVTT